jgi:orotate phosphoribosyltransferase
LQSYQQQFLDLAVQYDALCFGDFTLKSGRSSPYFFNAGRFCTAAALAQLGSCYAAALVESGIDFDLLFGPAYKGIPLVATTAVALVREHGRDTPYAFNRKEVKDHGEGGAVVGAPLAGRILVLDDVITAGTAVREATDLIKTSGADLAGILIGLDRRERGKGCEAASTELATSLGAPVLAIVGIDEVIEYVTSTGSLTPHLQAMQSYRLQWGPQDDSGA